MTTVSYKTMTQKDAFGNVLKKPENTEMAGTIIPRWWNCEIEDIGAAIDGVVIFIQKHQGGRKAQLTTDTRMYGNSNEFSILGTGWQKSAIQANPNSARITYNLAQSVIDTLVSKVAKNKVTPTFVTSGGVWEMQNKAEQLSKFVEGLFHALDVHSQGINAVRDACVWGDGFLHVFDDEGEVGIERVLPHEIEVDEIEAGVQQKPRQMHRTKIIDRDVLIEMFKDDEEKVAIIRAANPAGVQDGIAFGTASDMVNATESWHLKSGKNATDGVHVLSVGAKALYKKPWDKDYFPFVQISYCKRLLGFFSQGICELLAPTQSELNRNLILIQRSFWMGGSFKLLVENGSRVVSQHLNNEVGAIINYSGTPPQYITPPAIQDQILQYVPQLKQAGYQLAGLSQLSTTGEKPLGVDSGKALRTLTDIEDDRYLFFAQQVEAFFLEIGRQSIEVVKDIYSRKKTYKTTFPNVKFLETIDWKDIKLKESEYVMMAYPVSSLSKDVSGRLADIQELTQAGMMSPRTARKLMSMPDIEMSDKLANSAENLICQNLESMLKEDSEYVTPDETMDLALGRTLTLEYINYARLHKAPEEKVNLLRSYLSQIGDLDGTNAPQVPEMPQGPAPANPAPAPQSNLLPNVNQAQVA